MTSEESGNSTFRPDIDTRMGRTGSMTFYMRDGNPQNDPLHSGFIRSKMKNIVNGWGETA
jgi:hypothetical protein